MKLRSLTLENVRRFGGQRASLGPLGDGLTTISADNESGKSTFFDALHVLLFFAHNSSAKEVAALQPHSGGAVHIAATIEVDGRLYQIEKTYLAQKRARITDAATGQILQQQGEAEAWIDTHILQANKGPAGLLWVRQGADGVDPEGRGKDAENISARRDLMSSVQGQIDAVTGGRRMDKIVTAAHAALEEFATKSLKPKANGPWKAAEDAAAMLAQDVEELRHKTGTLSNALREKKAAMARLKALEDPDARTARATQIAQAKAHLMTAQDVARKRTLAQQTLELARSEHASAAQRLQSRTEALARHAKLAEDITALETALENAAVIQAQADTEVRKAKAALDTLLDTRRSLQDTLAAARTTEARAAYWQQLRDLHLTRDALKAPQTALKAAREVIEEHMVSRTALSALEDLNRRISEADALRQTQFARLRVEPSGAGEARIDGASLPPGSEHLIDREITLEINGFGTLHLSPASRTLGEDPAPLKADLRAALDRLNLVDLPAARAALAAKTDAQTDEARALAQIKGLAPDGPGALDASWAQLCTRLGHPQDTPPPETLEAADTASTTLLQQLSECDVRIEEARAQLEGRQETATKTTTQTAVTKARLADMRADFTRDAPQDSEADLADLRTQMAERQKDETAAQEALATLVAHAPELSLAQAEYDRLETAQSADIEETQRVRIDLAKAETLIRDRAEAAVEEKLAEAEAQLDNARARSDRFAQEAKAWALLIAHLDAARKDAQDTYFAPIREELRPLLAQLYDGADFTLDPDKMLVGHVIRNGVTDSIDVLSGGAAEQVAILTRLAFARLFARQGQHVPVILDDALVHTDDARIAKMFTLLTQSARDQQIIVFSCRTRAFADLGGTRATIEVEPV